MIKNPMDQYLRSTSVQLDESNLSNQYPLNLAAVKALQSVGELLFHPNVTFLVGENGSGKSTLLEAIATAYGFNPEGGTKNFNFSTEATHSELHRSLKLVKGVKKPQDGFFLRAESFYNLATTIDELDREGGGGAPLIDSYGGISLHHQSHGESFMAMMMHRINGRGLYIFDEPEAALSPNRQMTMLSRIHDLVEANSQFIIATHSPMLLAYPNAIIYDVDNGLEPVAYKETSHYQLMREFLNQPERMMAILMGKDL